MAEIIIRWTISVVMVILGYIMGYREGQVKILNEYIKATKNIEDGLLSIINDMYDRLNKYRDNDGRAK